MVRLQYLVFALLLSLMLSSCGFTLRGTASLQKYPALYLQGDVHSELLTQLGAQLVRNQVTLLDSPDASAQCLSLSMIV